MKYIDISEHQGVIDFDKVKPNVDGIIIRAGYGKNNIDKQFVRNVTECNRLGIPCGAYWFSYAKSIAEAKTEAQYLVDAVKPFRMELPMAFDFEYDSVNNAKKCGVYITKELATNMVYAFCEAIEAAGYWCLNYANPDFLSRYFSEKLPMRFGLWLAAWPNHVDVKNPPRSCAIWQWGGSSVPGISGNVDTNESYTDFAKIIRENGLNNINYTQTKPVDEKAEALEWAKKNNITENEEIALAFWQYHKAFGK